MLVNIICGGESLKDTLNNQENIDFINNNPCIFINKSAFLFDQLQKKESDYLIFIDKIIFEYYLKEKFFNEKLNYKLVSFSNVFDSLEKDFENIRNTENKIEEYEYPFIPFKNHFGEEKYIVDVKTLRYKNDNLLTRGYTTSITALSLALKKGFKKIVFWGLDMQGKSLINTNYRDVQFRCWIEHFNDISKQFTTDENLKDIAIYNFSNKTALKCFKIINNVSEIK
jgi:hypothetical protein